VLQIAPVRSMSRRACPALLRIRRPSSRSPPAADAGTRRE
jgi:hypothetical protein